MRLKIDTVTRTRSATQDGVRDKLALRAQLLDVESDLESALELAGKIVEATFAREQEELPGLFDDDDVAPGDDGTVSAENIPDQAPTVVVPTAGRRRHGTRSSEQVARTG